MNGTIGFYGIISEPVVGWAVMADAMVACGVRWIQLRMKRGTPAERRGIAAVVRARIPKGHHFIVNDHPELAQAVGADGVHLGQDDPSLALAQGLLGPGALIGLSTHNPAQVRAACAQAPAYIGVGPVFVTTTKLDAEPRIGLAGLSEMVRLSTVPAVAIGGIDQGSVASVVRAGAHGFCAVGAVNTSRDPHRIILALMRSV